MLGTKFDAQYQLVFLGFGEKKETEVDWGEADGSIWKMALTIFFKLDA